MKDRLRVAAGAVSVSSRFELALQLRMVVDLTVVGNPGASIAARHRLRAAGNVDDGQPAVSEPCGAINPQTLSVRTAVTQHVTHSLQAFHLDGSGVKLDDASNSAHGCSAIAFRRSAHAAASQYRCPSKACSALQLVMLSADSILRIR